LKVRFFTADSIQNAMAQVKNVLGRDAIILHTRTFRKGGFMGFFAKDKVEVMAAIDTPIAPIVEKKIQPVHVTENKNLAAVQLELATMRNLLEQALCKNSQEFKTSPILDLLMNNDIERHIAQQIIIDLNIDNESTSPVTPELKELIIKQIKDKVQCVEGIKVPAVGRKITAFIGPTGVGKTTTIAKLAAKFAIQDRYNVALITADTYRVSAVEQLKTYSDIMGIPIYVVYTADELKRALDSSLDKQLILIDTAGRSPHNLEQLEELEKFLQIDDTIEKHLVLSATTKYKDALDIVENFSACSSDKVIFTKLDEARNIGTIVNLLYQVPIPLSYVTNGQNVPDDIELVDPQKLAQLIFRN